MRVFIFLLILFLPGQVCAWDTSKKFWWVEIGLDDSYRTSDFWFEPYEDYGVFIFVPTLGLRAWLNDWLYLDPYFRMELNADTFSNEWNRVPWRNTFRFAPGIRLRFEYFHPKGKTYRNSVIQSLPKVQYFNLDFFCEYRYQVFLPRDNIPNSDEIKENTPDEDLRGGINSWLAIESKKYPASSRTIKLSLFSEMWTDFSYHSTNFFRKGDNDFLILTLMPKLGLRLSYPAEAGEESRWFNKLTLEPYYRIDFVRDFLSNEWNKEAWSNNIKYGPGIRIGLFFIPAAGASLYLYTEYLQIDYFDRAMHKAEAIGSAEDDYRVGVNLWFPVGASEESQGRRN